MNNYSEAHICQCLSRLATQKRNAVVTISGNHRKTGEQLVDGVLTLARSLLNLGLRNGDVVAIAAFNSDLYLEWLLAVAYMGGIVAPLNYRWSFEEARNAMETIRPKMLVTDESCYHWNSAVQNHHDIPSLLWHVSLSSPALEFASKCKVLTMETLLERSGRSGAMNFSYAPEGAVIICFTSGTTGKPKGVVISHTALIVQSLAKVAIVGYNVDDVYLHTAPLCHIGGLSTAMAMLMVGACHVFIPKFEAKLAIEVIEQHHVTALITVPAIMADLISLIRLKQSWKGRNSVTKILNGGGGLSDDLIKDTIIFFPRAKLVTAYGMTETCSSLTFMTLFEPMLEASGMSLEMYATSNSSAVQPRGICVGNPAPHVELKICSDGSSLTGRILTRGPHVMLRYWHQMQEKGSNSIEEEAWLDTGDVGFIDNHGDLWLVGRKNGRIKSGGENVYPEEVEAVLLQHPGIISAIVVGIPDPRLTEMVVACIRLQENWQWSENGSKHSVQDSDTFLSSEILRNYCKDNKLSRFKVPKTFVIWRSQFPLTSSGKIKRDQVRREVMSQLMSFPSSL